MGALFDLNGFLLCSLTFELPDGTISAQFINSPPPEKTFAVLGGTGAYAGREGYGVLVERGDGTGTLVFHWGGVAAQSGLRPSWKCRVSKCTSFHPLASQDDG